jgi:hypothetical protein
MRTSSSPVKLDTGIRSARDETKVWRLPRATQLPPVPGLPPIDAPTAVPDRRSIEPEERMLSPLLWLSSPTKFLVATAIAASLAGYLVFASSRPQTNNATAPQPTEASGTMVEGRAEPKMQASLLPAVHSSSDSDSMARSPETMPGADKTAISGETIAMRVLNAPSGTDGVLDAQHTEPLSERGEQSAVAGVQDSTCFPSASAVRQDQPGAWPSWTLRAPGHEGTRCWYAATRATAHDHQRAMLPAAPAAGSPRPQNGEYGSMEP